MKSFKLKGLKPHIYDRQAGLGSFYRLCLVYDKSSKPLKVFGVGAWWFPVGEGLNYQDNAFTRMLL